MWLLRQVVGKDHVGSNVISFGEIGKKLGGEWRAMDEVTPKTHIPPKMASIMNHNRP